MNIFTESMAIASVYNKKSAAILDGKMNIERRKFCAEARQNRRVLRVISQNIAQFLKSRFVMVLHTTKCRLLLVPTNNFSLVTGPGFDCIYSSLMLHPVRVQCSLGNRNIEPRLEMGNSEQGRWMKTKA